MQRRDFLQLTASGLAAALAARPLTLQAAGTSTRSLTLATREWDTLEGLCELLLPPVNGVSTRDAACVNFIDKALAHEDRTALPLYQISLAALHEFAMRAGSESWLSLGEVQRVKTLEAMEDGVIAPWPGGVDAAEFFQQLRFHTLLGFLADPQHGGNLSQAGWTAIGFPGHLHRQGGIPDSRVIGSD